MYVLLPITSYLFHTPTITIHHLSFVHQFFIVMLSFDFINLPFTTIPIANENVNDASFCNENLRYFMYLFC